MKKERLSYKAALERGMQLPYALIRTFSNEILGKTPDQIEEKELVEARFFDAEEEVRLFKKDGVLTGVVLTQEAEDSWIENVYEIEKSDNGSKIAVRYDLSADDDGQTYVSTVRLANWQGGGTRG